MIYLVKYKTFECVCLAATEGDACLKAEELWAGKDKVDESIYHVGLEEYKSQLVNEYEVKVIDRALCLQYVEWRLDGTAKVCIVLD